MPSNKLKFTIKHHYHHQGISNHVMKIVIAFRVNRDSNLFLYHLASCEEGIILREGLQFLTISKNTEKGPKI